MVQVRVPKGYERIEGDLNHDRANAPHLALCVRRDPASLKLPITDVMILHQEHNVVTGPDCFFVCIPPDVCDAGD